MLRAADLYSGFTLENRYRLTYQLGKSSYSIVWEVEDLEENCSRKAIKVCIENEFKAAMRLRQEFLDLQRLNTDLDNEQAQYIVKVENLYPLKQPQADDRISLHFMVMEKVRGCTLEEWILKSRGQNQEIITDKDLCNHSSSNFKQSQKKKSDTKNNLGRSLYQFLFYRYPPLLSGISYLQIAKWIEQLAQTLRYLHSKSIIYCDLKPTNMMITDDGDIKLIDFGTVKNIHDKDRYQQEVATQSAKTGLTLDYAAPEQQQGQVLFQSDFYSLGLTLLFALTGLNPLDQETSNKKNWRSQLPPELSNFLAKAIQEDPLKRHLNTEDLLKEAKQVARSLRYQFGRGAVAKQMAVVFGFAAIAAITSLAMRSAGWLQTWEFAAYDQMLTIRPKSTQKSPILIIAIRDQQNISDRDLAKVISNILPDNSKDNPSLISIGIKRDENVDHTGQTELEKLFQQNSNIFGSCEYDSKNSIGFDFLPKPATSLGFGNNLFYESQDEVRRIHLLIYKNIPQDRCTANVSSSLLLANYYLYNSYANPNRDQIFNTNEYLFGNAKFHNLAIGQGAYQRTRGNPFDKSFQILLDYHSFEPPQKESFAAIFKRKLSPEMVRGKIILIGRDDRSLSNSKDLTQLTPYGAMSSIELRSHMISQLISVAKGERPVLHTASFSLDLFWIAAISILSGFFCWRIPNSIGKVILIIVLPVALYVGCFLLLLMQGLWLGFVPMAIVSTSANVAIFLCFRQKVFI